MNITVKQAKKALEDAGYFTGNLWTVKDVQGKFECDDQEALEVLSQALENEATMDQIWFAIEHHGEEQGLNKIEK